MMIINHFELPHIFITEDNAACDASVTVYKEDNITGVVILLDCPNKPINKRNFSRRSFSGVSFRHPNDTEDAAIGEKMAMRHACGRGSGVLPWNENRKRIADLIWRSYRCYLRSKREGKPA